MCGTDYLLPSPDAAPPVPALSTGAIVGIVAGVVLCACAVLLYTALRGSVTNMAPLKEKKKAHRRLLVNAVFFDQSNRVLVRVDGVLPLKLAVEDLLADEKKKTKNSATKTSTRMVAQRGPLAVSASQQ